MSILIKEIQELEYNTRILNNTIDEVVSLRAFVDDIKENNDESVNRLLLRLNEVIDKYESMTTGAMAQIKHAGFKDERLSKYTESTYNGEKITACRIDNKSMAYVITDKGMYELAEVEEESMYSFSADSILLTFQGTDGLNVSKY